MGQGGWIPYYWLIETADLWRKEKKVLEFVSPVEP